MRTIAVIASLCVAAPAALLGAQDTADVADVMEGLRNGGGWVSIPIQGGVGSARTPMLPSVGITLVGCVNVWEGHSGQWEMRAHDTVTDSVLVITAEPGVGVPFSHTFGLRAQVDFDVRWSEPRDTTLLLWIGLTIGRTIEEACRPVFGG